jgi:5'-methylthioadenosine phosphorylase
MSETIQADIGIIGGSGFSSLFDDAKVVELTTDYGKPSAAYLISEIAGKKVAFLARHGTKHTFPPHKVPYRANIAGFKQLGVKYLISSCASGSLKPEIKPGDFVINDQFIDRTKGREETFFDGPQVVHIAVDEPYCQVLRDVASKSGKNLGYQIHEKGTVVVINGPRFSTKAESAIFRKQSWDVINMTQYPEVALAREMEMCYVGISLITDYDTGVKDDSSVKAVTTADILKVLAENNERVKKMIINMVEKIDTNYHCSCHEALKSAGV